VPVLEAVESHYGIRNYYHGNHIAGANLSEITPRTFASKLQARSPKYISLLNHIRIYLPEVNQLYYPSLIPEKSNTVIHVMFNPIREENFLILHIKCAMYLKV